MLQIIKHRKIWLSVSAIVVLVSMIGFFAIGLRYSIDFTGGALMEFSFQDKRPSVGEITGALRDFKVQPVIQPLGEKEMLVRLGEIDEKLHQDILARLKEKFGAVSEIRFESIGPTLGRELANKTIFAIILACLAIIAYIAFTFRQLSRPAPSWKYGVIAVVALIHDIAILTGAFVIFGILFNTEVGASFVAALLTTLGYSVNGIIVTFDRIRERLPHSPDSFEVTANRSINETLTRTVFTTLTTLVAILPVYLFGGETIKDFMLALMIGISVGAYSSIFLASPLLTVWQRGRRR